MRKWRILAILVAVIIFVGALSLLPQVTAQGATQAASQSNDTPDCVDKREFNSAYNQSRDELEKRWEVVGLGVDYYDGYFGEFVVYPMCGYEGKAFTSGLHWRGVKYRNHEKRILYLIWDH